jgi:hypothetical protein
MNCPYCGAAWTSHYGWNWATNQFFVVCMTCQSTGPMAASKEKALQLWMNRKSEYKEKITGYFPERVEIRGGE